MQKSEWLLTHPECELIVRENSQLRSTVYTYILFTNQDMFTEIYV